MTRPRIAIASRCSGQPVKQAIALMSRLGVEGIQLDVRDELPPSELSETGRRQLLHQLSEAGLRVASAHFPLRRPLHDPRQLDGRVAAIKKGMDFAYQLGARVLTCRLGPIPPDEAADLRRTTVEILDDLARHGNHIGVTPAISLADEPADKVRALAAEVTSGPLGIDFDPASAVIGGQDPLQAARALHDLLAHVRIRDAIRDGEGGGREVPVGRGEVPWDEFIPLLGEADFTGWLTIDRTAGDDRLGDAARAVQYLKQLMWP